MDVSVTCLYRNITTTVPAPQWYLDDERIGLDSLQLTEYNDTVWQMVYDYSALSPGEHVFHGKIWGAQAETDRVCCGPQPEVFLNLTVAAGKLSIPPDYSYAEPKIDLMQELRLALVYAYPILWLGT